MPYSEAQEKVLRARAHGWDPPGDAPFSGVSESKAASLLKHDSRKSRKMTAREAAELLASMKDQR
jgi:hypothetical protein